MDRYCQKKKKPDREKLNLCALHSLLIGTFNTIIQRLLASSVTLSITFMWPIDTANDLMSESPQMAYLMRVCWFIAQACPLASKMSQAKLHGGQ